MDELEEIVHWQSICEGVEWYYHLNITVKTKEGADDAGSTSLFFVEVACDSNDITGYYINTFSRVNTDGQGSLHSYLKLCIFGILFEIIC